MKRISRIACELNLSPLDRFVGKSCAEINSELDLGVNMTGKSFVRSIINRMIDKCGVEIDALKYDYKMVRVDQFGIAKNPSSFKVTDYHKIIEEEWETSDFRKLLEPTYVFFVVTHGNPETSIFKGYVIHKFSDDEMESALNLIKYACEIGIDAIIIQDMGLVSLIRKVAPNMVLHASTQMSVPLSSHHHRGRG